MSLINNSPQVFLHLLFFPPKMMSLQHASIPSGCEDTTLKDSLADLVESAASLATAWLERKCGQFPLLECDELA